MTSKIRSCSHDVELFQEEHAYLCVRVRRSTWYEYNTCVTIEKNAENCDQFNYVLFILVHLTTYSVTQNTASKDRTIYKS
jgi:hypothetical protein